ncbi:ParB/RepB/Spo0J family partition protein [Microbacterium amylolyticum]|uniref:ParB family chromosome partitioning protein n=1 Tax=Microbacterium amylolyticum TaxID=936337 RepID=A0ABS4ZHS3_9MICO|nr:ParB/RepB/Spo0J family partition protein [Microbacterium amylolyticum]MBP2436821.1 ParB family chromosome partitioning protein [Microbacterium amylolyticum]
MAKRTGLGRGIGALIPTSSETKERPADVFFAGAGLIDEVETSEDAVTIDAVSEPADAPSADATPAPQKAAKKPAAAGGAPATKRPAARTKKAEPKAPARSAAKASATPTATSTAKASNTRAAASSPEPELAEVPGVRLIHIDPASVVPNPRQPRTLFDAEDLAELVHSVREFGLLQPIVVRDKKDGTFELIMGERRTRASREAGLTQIPAIVRETADEDMLRDALLENIHRAQLNPLEEASAYQQLIEDFGITQDTLASRIGRSRPQISNTIRLLRLPEAVQQRVAAGVISAGHARTILSLDGDVDAMQKLADKIVNEELSVRASEEAARRIVEAGEKPAAPAPNKNGARRAYLDDVAERLGDRLNTKVKIALTARKGQVSIDFASIQDLNRILEELGETGYES